MRAWIPFAAIVIAGSISLRAAEPYHLIKEIPVGGAGGWDLLGIDPQAHRLYVSHATKVVVIDTNAEKVVGEIPDTPGVHGFAVAADLGRGFTSNGRENTSTIVDLKTLKMLGKVNTGGNPDIILYEPGRKEIYTFNGTGKSATVFDARTGNVVATIDLKGKPELAAADPAAHRIFVNIEDANSLDAIDTTTHTVVATWPLAGCEAPTGLAYAPAQHRLFSACSDNNVMTMTDSASGKVIASIPTGGGADGAAFDSKTGYVFTSNGEGTVTIAHLDAPNKLTIVQTLKTQPSARTMILDPVTHNIYLPAATIVPGANGGRGRPAPETFRVLVYGM